MNWTLNGTYPFRVTQYYYWITEYHTASETDIDIVLKLFLS